MATKTKKTVVEKPVTGEYGVYLSVDELTHLRDLMSIVLPPEGTETISAVLAQLESRETVDESLWKKICMRCKLAGIPLDTDAPNLIVAPSDIVQLSVFRFEPHGQQSDIVDKPDALFQGNTKKKQKKGK